MTDTPKGPPKADWPSRPLAFLALIFILLGGLGLLGYNAAFPLKVPVKVSELTPESGGLLTGDFSRSWPLKINKRALDGIAVTLPDGRALQRATGREALIFESSQPGFYVARPEITFRLDDTSLANPDANLTVTLPTQTRDILFHLPFGLATALFLASWLGSGLRASLKAPQRRSLVILAGCLAVTSAGLFGMLFAEGPALWASFLSLALAPSVAATTLLQAEAAITGNPSRSKEAIVRLAVVLGSVLGSCILFEAYLVWNGSNLGDQASSSREAEGEWFGLPEHIVRLAESRSEVLTLPDAWRRRPKTVEGASSAFTWHGALHIRDEIGFRRTNGPFPTKDPGTLRILVVGDSLTYGVGIEEEWTFSRLLERSLGESHRVEVINLGRSGHQSEDILGVLHRFMPRLDPDLVIYAACLNDFLPSGQSVYAAYSFPLPDEWKDYLLERTHLARLLHDGYNALLLALDLKADFYDDILAGEKNYRERYARDVVAMSRLVKSEGLPPAIGIVFDQSPGGDPRAWDLVEIAEGALAAADFDLVSVLSWRERFKDRIFTVSRWEGHPNELAHSILANELHDHITGHGHLQGYRRAAAKHQD